MQYDDLTVVLKEAENELSVMVEGTHEGFVRSRAHRLLERLEIAVGPPRRVVMFLESGKRLISKLVLFCAGRQGATGCLNLPNRGTEGG